MENKIEVTVYVSHEQFYKPSLLEKIKFWLAIKKLGHKKFKPQGDLFASEKALEKIANMWNIKTNAKAENFEQ